MGIKMCLVNRNNLHEPVMCKDFITDLFWAEETNQVAKIYGFHWRPKGKILLKEEHKMFMYLKDTSLEDCGSNLQNFLNEFEIRMNIPYSLVVPKDKGLLITFNKRWRVKPYLISLFTLLLRVGLTYNNDDLVDFLKGYNTPFTRYSANDVDYIAKSLPKTLRLLNQEEFEQEYSDYLTIGEIHNNSGIVSVNE